MTQKSAEKKPETYAIIGGAMVVHRELGCCVKELKHYFKQFEYNLRESAKSAEEKWRSADGAEKTQIKKT